MITRKFSNWLIVSLVVACALCAFVLTARNSWAARQILSDQLTTGYIYVGDNASNVAAVAVSGVIALASNGVTTFAYSSGGLTDNYIVEADLKAVDSATDEDILTYESTTGDFEWHSVGDLSAGIAADIAEGELADSTVVSADIKDGTVAEADLKVVDSPTDEDFLTYESTTGDFEWHSISDLSGLIAADIAEGELADAIVVEADLKVVDSPTDEDFLTYEATTGDFEWHSISDLSGLIAADIAEGELADAIVVEADLKVVDTATDEDVLTYEATTGDFEWHSVGELFTFVTTVSESTTERVCTSADYGKLIMISSNAAVTITLPSNGAPAGRWIDFMVTGTTDDCAPTIQAETLDSLVGPNDIDLDSVTYGSGHRLGAYLRVISDGALWHAINVGSTTMTGTD